MQKISIRTCPPAETWRPCLERAVAILGNQQKLADSVGVTVGAIWQLLNQLDSISAEMAVAVEKATGGAVSRSDLRPDLWPLDKAA